MDETKEIVIKLELHIGLNDPVSALPETLEARRMFEVVYEAMMGLDDNFVERLSGGEREVSLVFNTCKNCRHKRTKMCPNKGPKTMFDTCEIWERKQ